MEVLYGPGRIDIVSTLINATLQDGQSIADIGARDEALLKKINPKLEYRGFDIYPIGPNSEYLDIEVCGQFSKTFDMVVAIDVLEHTDDINSATNNLINMTDRDFIINLPNELWLGYRIKLMMGKISGKFQVNLASKDRHRWFFTAANVKNYITQTRIAECEYECFAFYRKSPFIGRFGKMLSFLGAHGIFAQSFIIVGRRK